MCPPNKGPIRVLCVRIVLRVLKSVCKDSCYLPYLPVACFTRRNAEPFRKQESSPSIALLHADEAK